MNENRSLQSRSSSRRFLSVGFVVLLALPLLQAVVPFVSERPLFGAEKKPTRIKLSLQTWRDGTFAQAVEGWISKMIGFRPTFVRLANQIQVAFGSNAAMYGNERIRVCKDGWLFANGYVSSYAAPSQDLSDGQIAEFVIALEDLQDRLRAQGKAMVFVISPSKAETYAEFLPDNVVEQRKKFTGVSDLDRLRKHLSESDVVFFDSPAYFQARRESEPHVRLYAKTGIHWTYQAAFDVWREILQLVNHEYDTHWPIPEQVDVEYDTPRGTDDDIARLLNLFFLPGEQERLPYPVVRSNALPVEARPRILFAGTSFSRTLVDSMCLCESGRSCDYLFYTSRQFSLPEATKPASAGTRVSLQDRRLDGFASVDWESTLLDKEIVVLEMLEVNVREFLYDFHHAAIAALQSRPATERLATQPEGSIRR
jgi:hypothetical protein